MSVYSDRSPTVFPSLAADEVRIEYEGPADDDGRRRFTMFWLDGRNRAQCFRADPRWYIERARESGKRVTEIE